MVVLNICKPRVYVILALKEKETPKLTVLKLYTT